MSKTNTARYTRGKNGKWQLLVKFNRHWEAPKVGTGLGKVIPRVEIFTKASGHRPAEIADVKLISRVFADKNNGAPMAFGEVR